jgi:predicted mannosyl-3-phosphoglycerate phosphatase (HAD superfamily)
MPFGLSNAPATFQNMMNHIFRDLLDLGLMVYLDDILIYAEIVEEHDHIVMQVLKCLAANGLAISQDKCFWSTSRVHLLAYVISEEGIEMAQDKVQCFRDWEKLRSLRDVQSFIGFANVYRQFIEEFSKIAKPLSDSTKGEPKHWKWIVDKMESFETLKHCFTTAPILTYFDP